MILQAIIVFVGIVTCSYLFISWLYAALYVHREADEPVDSDRVSIVVPTVAAESVRPSLEQMLDHHEDMFPDIDLYVVVDEGAALQSELEDRSGITCVVVPDDYTVASAAKGRAQQYFIDHHVVDTEWYVFVDDDAMLLDRTFLSEIPYHEEHGHLVGNGLLLPRPGRSMTAFVVDHMRTLYDLFLFRATTGFLHKPYAGLHGESLIVRGDVLQDIGFTEDSIVEDFVFSDLLIAEEYETWQSGTNVSILSPHNIQDFLVQRRRWLRGKWNWYPNMQTRWMLAISLFIDTVWLIGLFGGWIMGAVLLAVSGTAPLLWLLPGLIGAVVFSTTYAIGVVRYARQNSWLALVGLLLIPVYATIEHLAAYYALVRQTDTFDVIEK
jgi:egghead protein (zeste-white 4 protein)